MNREDLKRQWTYEMKKLSPTDSNGHVSYEEWLEDWVIKLIKHVTNDKVTTTHSLDSNKGVKRN